MKILITGGSGFIGTNVIKYYLNKGDSVLNIDIKPPKEKAFKSCWVKTDITSYKNLKTVILEFRPEYIIHLAARTDLDGKSIKEYRANTVGTENIIKIANQITTLKRVIFTSSMLVCMPGHIPKHNSEYSPTTFYGESKVEMEKIINIGYHNYEWLIVRPTSIWGPYFGKPYRDFFDLLIKNHYFHIGVKQCTKTYGYVENIIKQLDSFLLTNKDLVHKNTFYLGDYDPTNIRIWADEIAFELGISLKTIPFSLIKIVSIIGDVLSKFRISFPITSFRLKNMTTDNIVSLSNTQKITPVLPYTRVEGIRKTLDWIER